MKFRLALVSAVCAASLALVGCATTPPESRSMIEVAYKMADRMMAANPSIDQGRPLLVATAVNIDNLQSSSTFGRTLTELVASRIAQMGYTVSDIRLRNAVALRPQGELMLSRQATDVSKTQNAQAVVVGTYSVMKPSVYVTFKVVRVTDGTVLATADEVIPYVE